MPNWLKLELEQFLNAEFNKVIGYKYELPAEYTGATDQWLAINFVSVATVLRIKFVGTMFVGVTKQVNKSLLTVILQLKQKN